MINLLLSKKSSWGQDELIRFRGQKVKGQGHDETTNGPMP